MLSQLHTTTMDLDVAGHMYWLYILEGTLDCLCHAPCTVSRHYSKCDHVTSFAASPFSHTAINKSGYTNKMQESPTLHY